MPRQDRHPQWMRRRPRAVGPLPGSYPALHGARPACRRRGSGGLRAPPRAAAWGGRRQEARDTRQLRPCCHRQGVCPTAEHRSPEQPRPEPNLTQSPAGLSASRPRPPGPLRARARMPQSRRSDATERHPPAPVPIAPIRAPPGSQPTAQAAQARRLSEMPPDPPGSQRPGAGRPGARETRSVLQGDRPSCLPARGVGAYEPRFPYELFRSLRHGAGSSIHTPRP